jgi:hypothetical protein
MENSTQPKTTMTKKFQLGRKPRAFDPRVKRMGAVLASMPLPSVPAEVNWTKGIKNFGMMLNDRLGDCTCAAVFHARQIWTANTGVESTEPDAMVLKLYERACGYNPADPNTDGGGVEQHVLSYLYNTGIPLADGTVDKILGYVEVNHGNLPEMKIAINEFGLAYLGIAVPTSIYDANGTPLSVWDYVPNAQIEGGHAIILVGYDAGGFTFISWGQLFKMTWAFFANYCEEAYAIVDKNWIAKMGKTPLGLTTSQLEALMREIKE